MKNEEQGHYSMEGEGERRRWISNGWRKHPILLLTRSRGLSIDSGYTIILYTAVSKQRTIPQMKRRKLPYIFKKKDRKYYKTILFVPMKWNESSINSIFFSRFHLLFHHEPCSSLSSSADKFRSCRPAQLLLLFASYTVAAHLYHTKSYRPFHCRNLYRLHSFFHYFRMLHRV